MRPDPDAALDIVRDYHRRTKHRYAAYAHGPEALDWDAQPAPFRHFAGAPAVALPRIATARGALREALERPCSADANGAPLPLDLDSLGALLQLALGLAAWKSFGPDRWAVRANPSSGNLHPTEAYVLAGGVPGLADGLWHYRPEDHALELRAAHEGAVPGLGIVLGSVMWREAWKYGERAFRYCQLDTGHAVAALRQAAAVLGWSVAEQAHVGHDTLAALAGTDRAADFPARRQPETAREEAEVLLKVGVGETVDAGHPYAPAALRALAAAARWQGTASAIDPHPMYRWPVIEDVARATRAADGQFAPPPPRPAPLAPRHAGTPLAMRELILGRRSAQRFDGRHRMPLAAFAAILDAAFAAAPDSLAAPVLFVHRVEGLTPGLYLRTRDEVHRARLRPALAEGFEDLAVDAVPGLRRLVGMAPMELQRLARGLHCHQDIAANACFALGLLQPFDAALSHGPAAYRRLLRDCGEIGQALYLAAEAQGLRGTGIGCYFDDPVHEQLGLVDTAWQSLYHFTVGLPVADARIETTPAYADDPPDE